MFPFPALYYCRLVR